VNKREEMGEKIGEEMIIRKREREIVIRGRSDKGRVEERGKGEREAERRGEEEIVRERKGEKRRGKVIISGKMREK
jgi:hypothetical protein